MSASIYKWINQPELLNRESLYEIRKILVRYPYFQTAWILYIRNLYILQDSSFATELRKAALYIANRSFIFEFIERAGYQLPVGEENISGYNSHQEEPGLDRTLSLIDAFLATMPDKSEITTELDYTSDYTYYLLEEKEETVSSSTQLKGQNLIDNFLSKENYDLSFTLSPSMEITAVGKEEKEESKPDEGEDDSCFTETLAKIYIKQHRYSKALEIIKKLSLKYPKKNAYFADQIRFLEKLIINTKQK